MNAESQFEIVPTIMKLGIMFCKFSLLRLAQAAIFSALIVFCQLTKLYLGDIQICTSFGFPIRTQNYKDFYHINYIKIMLETQEGYFYVKIAVH